jgi:N-acetylmuramoyl-L-alanine amidase
VTRGRRRRPAAAAVAGALLLLAACGGGGHDASSTTSTSTSTSTTVAAVTTAPSPPSSTVAPVTWPAPAGGAAKVVVTPTGIPLPVRRAAGPGTYVATSPCGNEVTVAGTPVTGANVVLDPGHGGNETGATGPAGTAEKAVNLAVAQETQRRLEALGAKVVLTRTGDYRVTLATRAAIATALHPQLFLSIHHNAEPDGPRPAGPGSETYFQVKSPQSKRAAGLVYEEVVRAFSAEKIAWVADSDAGAKYRLANDGGDYYGVLRRTAGVPATLSEAAFLSNPPEEALLRTPAFQAVEAEALTRAVVRFVDTDDPGSGFVTPYPRTAPAGPGGGAEGCVDPPLG